MSKHFFTALLSNISAWLAGNCLQQFPQIHRRLGGEEDVDGFADARRGRRGEPEADGG